MISLCISGVKGLVMDANGSAMANVSLVVVGREFVPFRSWASGQYFRILRPGTYQIQVLFDFTLFSGMEFPTLTNWTSSFHSKG